MKRLALFASLVSLFACGTAVTVTGDSGVLDAGTGGGSSGGGTGGGTGGGSTGGGTGGGSTGGGTGGGSTGGGTGGGSTGGGTGGGSTGGGTGGGSTGGGTGGGSTGGGTGGGSATDGGTYLNGSDTCAMAPDVTAGGTFLGSTLNATDDYGPSVGNGCPSGGTGSGRDVAYLITSPSARMYTVKVTPKSAGFDPMLYAQLSCGMNACLGGTILNGPNQPESFTFNVAAGQTAYVIVDGEQVTKGDFEIQVGFTP